MDISGKTTSTLYKEVSGFGKISEKSIYQQNIINNKTNESVWDLVSSLPHYNTT